MASPIHSSQNRIYLLPSILYTAASDLAKKVQRVALAVIAKIQTTLHSTYTYVRSFLFTANLAHSDKPDSSSGRTEDSRFPKVSSSESTQEPSFIDPEEGVKGSASDSVEKTQNLQEILVPSIFSEKLPEKFVRSVLGQTVEQSSDLKNSLSKIQKIPFPTIKYIVENEGLSAAFIKHKHIRLVVEALHTGIEDAMESIEFDVLMTEVMKYFSLDAEDLTLKDKVKDFFIDNGSGSFKVKEFVEFLIANKKN